VLPLFVLMRVYPSVFVVAVLHGVTALVCMVATGWIVCHKKLIELKVKVRS
jgi:hypothetical protein